VKKPAALSAGLVAVKGTAAPVADMPTRSPIAEARAPKLKTEKTQPLNFKIEPSLMWEFKERALADRLKLNELFKLCFEAYCEKHRGLT
jgi:hypothetical protein